MTNLKQVISSVLRDMALAQYEANCYARELAKAGTSTSSATIAASGVSIGELTLTFRYVVQEGEDITEIKVLNNKENDKLLGNISEQLSKLMIRKLVHQVRSSNIPYGPNGFSYIEDLGDNRRLIDYLSSHMFKALKANIDTLYNQENKLEVDPIADQVLAVGEQYLFRHSDIEGLFALSGGQDLLIELQQILDNEVSDEISKIIEEEQDAQLFSFKKERSLRIEIDADRLKEYPAEAIQSITLKVVPQQMQEQTV